jgi:hypothetical protein
VIVCTTPNCECGDSNLGGRGCISPSQPPGYASVHQIVSRHRERRRIRCHAGSRGPSCAVAAPCRGALHSRLPRQLVGRRTLMHMQNQLARRLCGAVHALLTTNLSARRENTVPNLPQLTVSVAFVYFTQVFWFVSCSCEKNEENAHDVEGILTVDPRF